MKAVHFLKYGEKLRLRNISIPSSNASQILVKVKYAPINPSDIYFSQGVYGYKPDLP